MPIVFTEKACSRCHKITWDSDNGSYNETCTDDFEGQPCLMDIVRNYDENNDLVD